MDDVYIYIPHSASWASRYSDEIDVVQACVHSDVNMIDEIGSGCTVHRLMQEGGGNEGVGTVVGWRRKIITIRPLRPPVTKCAGPILRTLTDKFQLIKTSSVPRGGPTESPLHLRIPIHSCLDMCRVVIAGITDLESSPSSSNATSSRASNGTFLSPMSG